MTTTYEDLVRKRNKKGKKNTHRRDFMAKGKRAGQIRNGCTTQGGRT